MGKLIYVDLEIVLVIEDRALAHLQVVIGSKLRRGESFFMSWRDDLAAGGWSSIWLNRAIPLYFKFSGGRTPVINREWVAVLAAGANTGAGLVLVKEPGRSDI